METKVILITSYYRSKNSLRNREIDKCISSNIDNERIDLVFLLLDREYKILPDYFKQSKVRIIYTKGRQKYSDSFEVVNSAKLEFPEFTEVISIVCNSDIYFLPDDVVEIKKTLSSRNLFLALSRWEVLENGKHKLHDAHDSQDSWIFLDEIKPGFYDYPFGIPGCDNRIAYELEKAGYKVINPSYSIRSFHLHLTNYRNYNDETPKIQPPYGYVKPY